MDKKTLLIIGLTLLVGGLIGFIVAGRVTKHRMDRLHKIAKHEGPHEAHRLAKILDLTEEQKDSIRPILKEHRPHQREMFETHRKEMDALRDKMFADIKPFLTEEQVDKLEHLREQTMHKRHHKRMKRKEARRKRRQERNTNE